MKRFAAFLAALSFLLLPVAPAFAQLGDVTPPPPPPTDTTPPVISGVVQSSLLPTGITLAWTTNELATSQLRYGLTTSYGSTQSASVTASLAHTATLTGLAPSTTYYYCIDATDTSNNLASSCSSFTTAAAPDVAAPIVSVVVAVATTTSATITWTTNEAADSQVEYGTTSSYGMVTNANATLALTHSVELTNLTPNTTYHYRVLSKDASANLTTGSDLTFTTSAMPSESGGGTLIDTTPPVITDISSISLEPTHATILWTTDELATSTLTYGTTLNYGSSATLPADALLPHSATLLGLTANTTYYFCIRATDLFGNSASSCSSSNTFTTAAAQTTIDTTPPSITLVTVAPITTTSADFNWTTSEVGNGYVEYGTTDAYGSQTPLDTNLSLTHSASLTGLTPNTTYHYRVHSSDEAGNTSITPDETFTTSALPVVEVQTPADTTPPSISNVLAAPIGGTQATIGWETDELATATLQYGLTTSYGSSASVSGNALLTHSATLLNLAPDTTYYYCIHATDLAGNTANSCGHSFTTLATPVIVDTTAPEILVVTAGSVTTSSATVAWSTSEAGSSQVAYGPTSSYGSSTTLDSALSLTHTVDLTGLTPNTIYHYQVRSSDAAGNLGVSTDNTFTTSALPSIEVAPPADTTAPVFSLIAVAPVATSSASVSWTTNELANGQIEYGTSSSYGNTSTLDANYALTHTFALTNLTPDTTYHFQIRSVDESGNVALSSDETFTTDALPVVVVSAPVDTTPPVISGIAEASLAATSTAIAWETSELATSTLRYGTTTSYGSSATLPATAFLAHSTTLLNLTPGTTYYYCIYATDLSGNSANSCGHSFTTEQLPTVQVEAPPVSAPVAAVLSDINAESIGETSVTITWSSDLPADSRVEYGDEMEFDETASSSALVTSHSVTLSGLAPNTVYDFRVVSTPAGTGAMETVSSIYDFTTLATPIVIDPPANVLSVSDSSVTASAASVSFTTDEMTTGQVEYGLDASYGSAVPWSEPENAGMIAVSGLLPATTYHYRVKAIDSAGNITYSEDRTFTTAASVIEPLGGQATSTPSETTTTEPTAPAPAGNGGGGGGRSSSFATPTPALVTAGGMDSQIAFIWNNPLAGNFANTVIVRGTSGYPTSPSDGQVIYSGPATSFTDTNLTNGTAYYYALYSQGTNGAYSNALKVSAVPAAGVNQVQLDENPVLQPALATEHFSADLAFGDSNLEVEHLQQILNTVNVHPSGLTTGYFGPLTQAALKTFQAKYSLPQTGVADSATRAVLNALSQSWMLPSAPSDIATLTTDLKRGDSGVAVANLQEFLAYEGSYEEGIVSGTYGPLTQESVADFQTKYGVTPVSGYVGPKTRHTIQAVLGL